MRAIRRVIHALAWSAILMMPASAAQPSGPAEKQSAPQSAAKAKVDDVKEPQADAKAASGDTKKPKVTKFRPGKQLDRGLQ